MSVRQKINKKKKKKKKEKKKGFPHYFIHWLNEKDSAICCEGWTANKNEYKELKLIKI